MLLENRMNVLIDYVGHSDLENSMSLLFEKRLGMNVLHPAGGPEWDAAGVFTGAVNTEFTFTDPSPTSRERYFPFYKAKYKDITFQQFIDTDFDIVVTTSKENEYAFYNLVKNYKPKAKFIRMMANVLEPTQIAKNVLRATSLSMPASVNWITYCPEHSDAFSPSEPESLMVIKSFWNYMPSNPVQLKAWLDSKQMLSDHTFKMHGILGVDGWVERAALPDSMKESALIFQTKAGACGYVARQALACGKPLIFSMKSAKHFQTLAANYLKDGVNAIDLDTRSLSESVDIMRQWTLSKELYSQKSLAAAETFSDAIFHEQAMNIGRWIELIKPGMYLV